MAHIFRIDRAGNEIFLGDASTKLTGVPLTASLLISTDASKRLTSVTDLTAWVAGTANQVIVTDDTDGTVTLSAPQDIHTGATPTFAGVIIADGGTVGQAAGPLITFNDTDNYLGIAGCNIGLGTLTPDRILTVIENDADAMYIRDNSGADVSTLGFGVNTSTGYSFIQSAADGTGTIQPLKFYVGSTERMDIATDGVITVANDLVLNAATAHLIIHKDSTSGIQVDTSSPTYPWRDLLGDQFSKNTGGTKPLLTTYNVDIDAWQFSDGDEAFLTYHIPHDYVLGTDIHLHIHWSQNNAGATGGTIDFKYFAIYAKAYNQVSGSTFTSTPKTDTFSSIDINDGDSGLHQYQQFLTEVVISAATATGALFDRDDFEPDGVIELTLEMDANNLTGTPSDPFIHYVDIHYQSTGIGTKDKAPDFYA
jgi:hypothetical protein